MSERHGRFRRETQQTAEGSSGGARRPQGRRCAPGRVYQVMVYAHVLPMTNSSGSWQASCPALMRIMDMTPGTPGGKNIPTCQRHAQESRSPSMHAEPVRATELEPRSREHGRSRLRQNASGIQANCSRSRDLFRIACHPRPAGPAYAASRTNNPSAGHRDRRRPLRTVLPGVLRNEPHAPYTNLERIPALFRHGPIRQDRFYC